MHADKPAVQRKGVDPGILDDEVLVVLLVALGLRAQPGAEVLHVIGNLGIIEQQILVAHFADDHAPDLIFIGLAERRVLRRAHVGQLAGDRRVVAGRDRIDGQPAGDQRYEDSAKPDGAGHSHSDYGQPVGFRYSASDA